MSRTRVLGVGAATAALHVGLIALAWHAAAPMRSDAQRLERIALRLVSIPPRRAATVAPAAARPVRAVAVAAPPPAAKKVENVEVEAPPPAEPVSGAAFGLPQFGYGTAGTQTWGQAPAARPAAVIDIGTMAALQAEAERMRMLEALKRQASTLPPLPGAEAECEPPRDSAEDRCRSGQ